MASKRRPKSSRRVSKAELRRRAKQGWITRRQKYTREQIRAQASKGGKTQALYEENQRLQEELERVRRDAELEKIGLLEAAKVAQATIDEMQDRIRHLVRVDPLYEERKKHFSDDQYLMLFGAQHDRDFEDKARTISAELGLPLREVYTLWLSPE